MPTEDPGQTGAVEASPGVASADRASPDQASPDQDSAAQPGPPLSPAQLAREALARAKADARARGDLPAGGSARPSPRGPAGQGGRPRRPRRDDPQPLTMAIRGLIGDQGWQTEAAMGSVF